MGSSESALKKYIDSRGREGRDRLRELLKDEAKKKHQEEEANAKYSLLIKVRGVEYSTWTGLHSAAYAGDLKTIRYLLLDFSANQIYNVVEIPESSERTALHIAADRGHTSIINYLLSDFFQQQKYDLLKIQDMNGDTALHLVAINKNVEAVQAIISSVSSPLLIQLLNIKNKEGQTVTDIRPELHDELPVLIVQSRSTQIELLTANFIQLKNFTFLIAGIALVLHIFSILLISCWQTFIFHYFFNQ